MKSDENGLFRKICITQTSMKMRQMHVVGMRFTTDLENLANRAKIQSAEIGKL